MRSLGVACILSFFFQAEDGIRDLVRSRGLGDVYKRQGGDIPQDDRVQVQVRAGDAAVFLHSLWHGVSALSLIHI